jgi:hypothetical protein
MPDDVDIPDLTKAVLPFLKDPLFPMAMPQLHLAFMSIFPCDKGRQ